MRAVEGGPRVSVLGKQGESKVSSLRANSLLADLNDWVTKALAWNTWFLFLVFVSTYVLSFLFFACMWYALHVSQSSCLEGISTFNDALQFSMETQATIGYGFKRINGSCQRGTVLLLVQLLTGYFIDAMMLSIIYSKLTQSKRRGYLLRCSRFAVITHRNKQPCLLMRVGDRRHKASLISTTCRMFLLSEAQSSEGEYMPYCAQELQLDTQSLSASPYLFIPWTVTHYITPESPLHGLLSRDALAAAKAEIVLVIEGTVQEVGLSLQLRTSYTPDEVLFHHRFTNIIHRHAEGGCWVDWAMFDQVEGDGHPDAPQGQMQVDISSVPPVVLNVNTRTANIAPGTGRRRGESVVEHPGAALASSLAHSPGQYNSTASLNSGLEPNIATPNTPLIAVSPNFGKRLQRAETKRATASSEASMPQSSQARGSGGAGRGDAEAHKVVEVEFLHRNDDEESARSTPTGLFNSSEGPGIKSILQRSYSAS